MTNLEETVSVCAVYRVHGNIPAVDVTSVPQRAKSRFAEEYDVPYRDCRANLEEVGGTKYVIVGLCDG